MSYSGINNIQISTNPLSYSISPPINDTPPIQTLKKANSWPHELPTQNFSQPSPLQLRSPRIGTPSQFQMPVKRAISDSAVQQPNKRAKLATEKILTSWDLCPCLIRKFLKTQPFDVRWRIMAQYYPTTIQQWPEKVEDILLPGIELTPRSKVSKKKIKFKYNFTWYFLSVLGMCLSTKLKWLWKKM